MKSNQQYKQLAAQLLKGNMFIIWIIIIIFGFILGFFNNIAAEFAPVYKWNNHDSITFMMGYYDALYSENWTLVDPGNPFLYSSLTLVSTIISGYVIYGLTVAFIELARSKQPALETVIFTGVKEQPLKAPLLHIVQIILITLWSVLLIIPGIIKFYSYAMSIYLLKNEPELDTISAITKSKNLMRGHKSQLFLLDLWYFLLYILSPLTFFIALIWIIPRHQLARTLMFEDIYANNEPQVKPFTEQ
jgi:uncharacterized membrane protein